MSTSKLQATQLTTWFTQNQRPLFWRKEYQPYHIWIVEIMGQQTQIERVERYFLRWIAAFPSIDQLTQASLESVMKYWEGLGYYSRCKNLYLAAQIIQRQYQSQIPDRYSDLIKLPGVGKYTAGAVLSIAYNQHYSTIDGNMRRVLSRLYDWDQVVQLQVSEEYFELKNKKLMQNAEPRIINQALMELGATICKPKSPLCSSCPVQQSCLAYKNDIVGLRPLSKKKLKYEMITMSHFIIEYENHFLLYQDQKWWQNLFSFPLAVNDQLLEFATFVEQNLKLSLQKKTMKKNSIKHGITKYKVVSTGYYLKIDVLPQNLVELHWFSKNQLAKMSLSKPARFLFDEIKNMDNTEN